MFAPRSCLAVSIALASFLPAAAPPPGATPARIAKWIEELGDDSFATREAAMRKLADAGAAAEVPLRAAMRSTDAEVSRRARTLLEQFRWGIYPDTPEAVVKLIRAYKTAAGSEKRDLLRKLLAAGPHGSRAVGKIARYEEDPNVRKAVFADIAASIGKVAPALLDGEKRDELEGLLEVGVAGDPKTGVANYAAYYLLTNRLPARIAEWEARAKAATVPKTENEVLAYLYRANGDLARARKAAVDADRDDLLRAVLYEAADWKTLAAQSGLAEGEADPTRLGYRAAFARLSGDRKGAEAALAEIVKIARLVGRGGDKIPIAKALFINGDGAAGAEILAGAGAESRKRYDILVAQNKYEAAFALVEKARKDGSKELATLEILEARALHLLGEKDRALAVFEKYAKKIAPGEADVWGVDLVEAELAVGRRDAAFATSAKLLVSLADNRLPERLFQKLFGRRRAADAHRLRLMLRRIHDREDDTKILPRLRALLDAKAAEKEIDALIAAVAANKLPAGEDAAEESRILGDLAAAYKQPVKAAKSYKEAGTLRAAVRIGDLMADQKQWRDAAGAYLAAYQLGLKSPPAERDDEGESLPALALYLSGDALVKAGDARAGKERIDKAHLLPLGDAQMRYELSQALANREKRDGARREQELLRKIGEPVLTDPGSYYTGEGMRAGALEAMSRKKWLEAADGFEQSFLRVLQPHMNFTRAQAYVSVPAFMFYLRARGLIVAGRLDEAKLEIARAQGCVPGQIDVAIYLVPELDARGRKADADALYASSLAPYTELVKAFPKSAFALNQVAWVSACCRRDLEQASKYVRKALELDQDNPAYLDTHAEVLFQLGKQAEAIAAQKKVIALVPGRKYFARQLKRIEAGDPKAPRPVEEE